MKYTLVLIFAAACATSHTAKLEQARDVDQVKQVDRADQVDVNRKTTTGPSLILEFGPVDKSGPTASVALPDAPSRQAGTVQSAAGVSASGAGDGLPPHGPLLKATFVGGSTEELTAIARAQEHEQDRFTEQDKTTIATVDQMAPAMSCATGGILWAIAAIGAVALAWRILRR